MTLKQQMQADATLVFLNTNEFAESVAYRSLGIGATRTISAVVFREALSGSEESRARSVCGFTKSTALFLRVTM